MDKEKDNNLVEQTNEQGQEIKEKKKHKGLKVTAAVTGGLVATSVAMSIAMPNVTTRLIDKAEGTIHNITGLSFDINSNGVFGADEEDETCVYGSLPVDGFEVKGFE